MTSHGYASDIELGDKRSRSEITSTTLEGKKSKIDDDRIKEIGKRTRTRFEEERSKRKEIIRIDETVQKKIHEKSYPVIRSSVKKKPTATHRQNRRLHESSSIDLTRFTTSKSYSEVNVDKSKKTSDLVRVHGFPSFGTTVQIIRKFFLGLNLQEILLLPTLELYIPYFDANNTPEMRTKTISNTTRILVKFSSKILAQTAIGRSGETISVQDHVVAISVSPIDQQLSECLKKMAIPFPKESNTMLSNMIDTYRNRIPKIIGSILWYDALKVCGNTRVQKVVGSDNLELLSSDIDSIYPPRNDFDNNLLISTYNKLVDLHASIEESFPLVQLTRMDPDQQNIEIIEKLAIAALNSLELKMKMIEKCLLHVEFCNNVKTLESGI